MANSPSDLEVEQVGCRLGCCAIREWKTLTFRCNGGYVSRRGHTVAWINTSIYYGIEVAACTQIA